MIKDIVKEGPITLECLIARCERGKTAKNTPYLSLALEDSSGMLDAKFWNLTEEMIAQYTTGMVVEAHGDILFHRNAIQLRVRKLIPLEGKNVSDYVQNAPMSKTEMEEEITEEKLLELRNLSVRYAGVSSLEGLEGRVYVLADEKPETPPSGQVTYLTPEAFLPEGAGPGKELADGAVFMMRGKYSLEERANLLRRLTGALRPGGRILIPEEIYRYCSVGRTGMEILLTAFGVRLEVPVYGGDRSIVGTVESCG